MHYKSGKEVQAGDVCRGKGYNIPYEVCGVVVGMVPGATTCNLTVAHVGRDCTLDLQTSVAGGKVEPLANAALRASVGYEYGQADAFELVCRRDGSRE
jgi:hypothetical protein